jgi:hypothetical protein
MTPTANEVIHDLTSHFLCLRGWMNFGSQMPTYHISSLFEYQWLLSRFSLV